MMTQIKVKPNFIMPFLP